MSPEFPTKLYFAGCIRIIFFMNTKDNHIIGSAANLSKALPWSDHTLREKNQPA